MVLNESVTPVSCAVQWVLGKDAFSGSCTWSVSVEEACSQIRMHAELSLDSIKVSQHKRPVKLARCEKGKDGQLCLCLDAPLQPGRAEVLCSFSGKIEGTVGIHRSGLDSPVVQTHFEVSHARKALPCFDLTSIKAAYRVSVTLKDAPAAARILGNMPAASERRKGADLVVEFQETPPIPAYVLAFVAFPMELTVLSESVELPSGTVVEVGACIVPNPKYPLDMVMKAAVLGLQRCSDWMQVDYPLPKLDVAVVPKLCLGGMENHGLVFLDGTETTPGKGKKAGADSLIELLMHEIAHMWCGNLVGLDFWVKEGLAQFFEKVLADEFLGRPCSLPSDSKMSLEAVAGAKEAPKKAPAKPAAKAGKPKKLSKKAAAAEAAAAAAAERQAEATDAVDNHDVFNGNMYTKSYLFTVGLERELGRQEFLSRLSQMLSENADGFVDEATFLKAFGREGLDIASAAS